MILAKNFCCAFLILVLSVNFAEVLGQETPVDQEPDLKQVLADGWAISYRDLNLGWVHGRATLMPSAGMAEVTLVHPQTQAETSLRADSVTIDGNNVQIVLPAHAFGAPIDRDIGFEKLTPASPLVNLSLGGPDQQITLGSPSEPDQKVTINLTYDLQSDMLSGRWHQKVDAVTGRVGDNSGRFGHFHLGSPETGGGEMYGTEVWLRHKPEIKGSFAVFDQLGSSVAGYFYPYPFTSDGTMKEERAALQHDHKRIVMVLGKHLPLNNLEQTKLESLDEDVTYKAYRYQEYYKKNPQDTFERDKAFERLEALKKMDLAPYEHAQDDEFILLEATLKPGVKPGRKTLRVNGVETEWLLRFGDHRAEIGFSRDLAQDLRDRPAEELGNISLKHEFTEFVYRPEAIYIEIKTETRIPIETLPILVARNGEIIKFGPLRAISATLPDPEAPNTYRTPPIYLIKDGQQDLYPKDALTLVVEPQDVLQAALADTPILALSPNHAQAVVLHTPQDMSSAISGDWSVDPVTNKRNKHNMLWREAVYDAAVCAGIDEARQYTNANDLTRLAADSYSDFAIGEVFTDAPVYLTTEIKIGEHAGMIMIRQILLELMHAKMISLDASKTDDEILGLRSQLEKNIRFDPERLNTPTDDLPLNKVKIKDPSGKGMTTLASSFYPDILEKDFGIKGTKIDDYQLQAMREARVAMVKALKDSIKRVDDVDHCDVYELTQITGYGMKAVATRTNAALMKLKEVKSDFSDENGLPVTRQRLVWVPDLQARARVETVALVADRLRIQEEISNQNWESFIMAVGLATLPVSIWGAGAGLAADAILVTTATLDALDLLTSAVWEYTKLEAETQELNFALGVTTIAGTRRYNIAKENQSDRIVSAASVLFGAFQLGMDVKDIAKLLIARKTLHTRKSVERGTELIVDLNTQSADGPLVIRELTERERDDVLNAVIHVVRRESTLGLDLLETAELDVLKFSDLIESGVFDSIPPGVLTRPWWTDPLSEAARVRLEAESMLTVDHVRELITRFPERMQTHIMDDDALYILKKPISHLNEKTPANDLAAFEEAVARHKKNNNIPDQGPDHYDQTFEMNGSPEDIHYAPISVHRDKDTGGLVANLHAYQGRHDAEPLRPIGKKVPEDFDKAPPYVAHFTRSRIPDDIMGTGKDTLVFDLAQPYRHLPYLSRPNETFARVLKDEIPFDKLGPPRINGPLERTAAPRKIYDVAHPTSDVSAGVPFVMFTTMRMAQALGFEHADASLGVLKLNNVFSANTAAELHWLAHTYPDEPLEKLFRYTHSYRYAEATARQMGFRISEATDDVKILDYPRTVLEYEAASKQSLLSMVQRPFYFDPGKVTNVTELSVSKRRFMEAYLVPQAPEVPVGFDVYLKLEPIGR